MPRSDRAAVGWSERVAEYLQCSAEEQGNRARVVALLTEQPDSLRELSHYLAVHQAAGGGPGLERARGRLSPAAFEVLTLCRIGAPPQPAGR